MGREVDDVEEDEDEYEDVEQVLFQGPMFGRETNLKQNPRLVKAALVLVKKMVSDGLSRRAHKIILEPARGRIVIRFVIDGIPYPAGALPGQKGMAMIQMVKVLAGLNPQERKQVQSGGIKAEYDEARYELLTQFTPLKPGIERLVINIGNPKVTFLKAANAKMPDEVAQQLRQMAENGKGIILACGAPESGVTSLSICALHCVDPYLYSVYSMADTGTKELTNVSDFEPEEGHDLELSLDRIIRREADVVFMDPLTDPAVVQTMFEFADRLCFVAEIDAKNPAEAIQQLVEWVGADLVASRLAGIVSQKLIRALCDDCKQAFRPSPALLKKLSLPPETTVLYRAPTPPPEDDEDAPTIEELCEDCDGMPYHGRVPVYEVLEMTDDMKQVVTEDGTPEAIKNQMTKDGMRTLQRDAIRLVVSGATSLEEVQRSFRPPGSTRRRRPQGRSGR